MAVFKCKMCGGTLEIQENQSVAVCDYCGTKQTLPKIDSDRKANLFDRANYFRRNTEFDKAMTIYEQMLAEENTDAEIYWSIVLCRYGIEYVEDPDTHERVPTVNRAQYTSIFADEDYKSALQFADDYQRSIYEEEAKAIDEIQKGILAISSNEEPFDIFICYKETDDAGRRTPDSVIAYDVYQQLTDAGYKVFFSRVTLEDKIGSAYEPYIFAALNSAKIMIVIGTKKEYFEAVWVKNEWSRYLSLIKQGQKKTLIPAFKDMDPYSLPEEFAHLQAQDMSKLGFMQDLRRGIGKIISAEEVKENKSASSSLSVNVSSLLERAFIFLEDGQYSEANQYAEKVLDMDPKNGNAYLVKLLVDYRLKKTDELGKLLVSFEDNNNYSKVNRYGDENLCKQVGNYLDQVKENIEEKRKNDLYEDALEKMKVANDSADYLRVATMFKKISGYKDSDEMIEKCKLEAELTRKEIIYQDALRGKQGGLVSDYMAIETAITKFQSIIDYKDSAQQIEECRNRLKEVKLRDAKYEAAREKSAEINRINEKKKKKRIRIIVLSIILAVVLIIALISVFGML